MSIILIVEDDPAIVRGLTASLRLDKYDVISAVDGEIGYQMARERKPDLVILDLMLPNMSGFEICRKLREENFDRPILMLTARSAEGDRVHGLDLGADDYVTKPFSIRELQARVRALLRRGPKASLLPDELRFDEVFVNFQSYEAQKRGTPIELTPKEFGILRVLAAKPGTVVSRDDLLNEVWGFDSYPNTRTVDAHIATLRAKLEDDPAEPRRLLTVHGVGYKLMV